MKDNFEKIAEAMDIIIKNIIELDKKSGPVPDSIFQCVRRAFRTLDDEIFELFLKLRNFEGERK